MNVLSNFELNKIKHIENTLEKAILNALERYGENGQNFGIDLLEVFKESDKSRRQAKNNIKKGIQNIVISLRFKFDMLKHNKIGEIKDFDKIKEEMIEIQETIFNTKAGLRSELKNLAKTEDNLNDELNLYYNCKIAEWNESSNINTNCEYVQPRVKSKHNGQCKEVKRFFDFVQQSGGPENGWRKDDHLLFLKLRARYKKIEDIAFHLHDNFPDIPIEEIKAHEEWYKKYLNLQSKKKDAINKWKENKRNKNMSKNLQDTENDDYKRKYIEDAKELREKLLQWKTKKEEELLREKEFEKQRMLDKIEKERLIRQRQIKIKSIVNEWRESKKILEETKKQHEQMFEIDKKRRSGLTNKLIKQFQSMDELYILKMRQIRQKLTEEPSKRIQSGPPVSRDPKRVMQPTAQWVQRVRAIKEPPIRPIPIFAAPKLAIPEWRKTIS